MSAPCPTPSRRTSLLWLTGLAFIPAAATAALAGKIVTVLGDSITAGLGLPAAYSLPVQLQTALKALGKPATVRGAGVSGDTSAGGLARVGFSVQSDTTVCLVALGGNDLLQGIAPEVTKANLSAIIDKLAARRIGVVLAGLEPPQTLGGAYARDFSAIFPAIAKAKGITLYPNLLAGVALDSRLNQADGLHPNSQGVAIIAKRLAPVVAKALG